MSNTSSNEPIQLTPPKHGKVAKILSSTQVVLNFGKDKGATVGSRYRIVLTIDINDPDNPDKLLDRITFTKGTVEVTQVFSSVSVARPPEQRVRVTPKPALSFENFLTPQVVQEKTVRNDLNVARTQVSISSDEREIHVGDSVVLVEE